MNARRTPWLALILLAVAAFFAVAGRTEATVYHWDNTDGGWFSSASNWNPNTGYPQTGDTAIFNLNGYYVVNFGAHAASSDAYIEDDWVTFDLRGYSYDIAYTLAVGWYGGDNGRLEVRRGNITSSAMIVGEQQTASGDVVLSSQAHWNATGGVYVGYQGEAYGSLTIESASTLQTNEMEVGLYGDACGSVYVDGIGSSIDCTGAMYIGAHARGVMQIDEGATAHCDRSYVGYATDVWQTQDPYGIVFVGGAGSRWTIDNETWIGYYENADGRLTINSGGSVECGLATLAQEAGSRGTISVAGAGASFTCNGSLLIGNRGYGSVSVSDEAVVSTNGTVIAATIIGTGLATLEDTGTVWNEAGRFDVGNVGGSGTLVVSSGATLNVANTLAIWDNSSMTLDGGNINTGSFVVGDGEVRFKDGTLTLLGGTLEVASAPEIPIDGELATDLPTFRMLGGASARLTCPVEVGVEHRGVMELRGGSVLLSDFGSIGTGLDSAGTVTVADPGSSWEPGGLLFVGYKGSGVLDVLNGGEVWTYNMYFGAQSGASAVVTVAGTGAQLATDDNIYVGGTDAAAGGTAVLKIETGGTVDAGILKIWSPGTVNLDGGTLSVGQLIVSGGVFDFSTGTLRLTSSDLTIGAAGPLGGSVELAAGQHVDTLGHNTTIEPGARLCVESGASLDTTTLNNSGELQLAGHSATLLANLVYNTGLIHGSGQINAPLQNATQGQIRVASGDSIVVAGASNSNAGTINLEGGALEYTGVLTNANTGFISGRGTLRAAGGLTNQGVLALSGGFGDIYGDVTNDVVGQSKIVVTGGGLTTFYDDVHSNGTIRISAGCAAVFLGELAGSGGTSGTGTAYVEGDLRPGSSPAVVHFGGDLVLGDPARLEIELAGTDPGDFDVVDAAGTLSLAGTLDVQLIDSFMPWLGDTFDVLDWGVLDGEFDAVSLPTLASYLKWNTTDLYVTGAISVTYATVPGDANLDGYVNQTDAETLAAHWGDPGGWTEGDFTFDGVVDAADAAILAANWGYGTSESTTVPEPRTLALLAMGVVGLFTCGRRREQRAIVSETRGT